MGIQAVRLAELARRPVAGHPHRELLGASPFWSRLVLLLASFRASHTPWGRGKDTAGSPVGCGGAVDLHVLWGAASVPKSVAGRRDTGVP